jgi:hypothetical protein
MPPQTIRRMMNTHRPIRLLLGALGLLCTAAVGGGCAASVSVGSRPAAFPGAPAQPWVAAREPTASAEMRAVLETAVSLRGSRYQFGGALPATGFDCSGFVQYVFAQHELDVPRTTAEQYDLGRTVARSDVEMGDLLFFSTTGPGATHVGIVIDPVTQTFVHAPGTGSVVRIERYDTPYWRRRLLGARRLQLPGTPAQPAVITEAVPGGRPRTAVAAGE